MQTYLISSLKTLLSLVLFTISEAYSVGFVAACYNPEVVFQAFLITTGITLTLKIYKCFINLISAQRNSDII